MKSTIAKKWIVALRSGKYKQGREALRSDKNKYCCLGVLCDLYRKEKGGRWKRSGEDYEFLGQSCYTPSEVQRWAGLETWGGGFSSFNSLTKMNDEGKDFKTIAKTISQNIKNL